MRAPLALAAALSLLAAGCADEPRRSATYGGPSAMPEPVAVETQAGCLDVEHPPEQSGGHLLGDATPPVPYSSVPPTSGWHASGKPARGVHGEGDPLSEPEQVTILELGGVVVTWNGLAAGERAELEEWVTANAEVVASSPYEEIGTGHVALAAWGVLQRCDRLDLQAIAAFVAEHQGGGPEH